MNIIGIIPARMGSTRFPGKPLASICEVPMVGHVYFRSKLCSVLNDVYIATCDKEIADYAKSINAKVIMTSDKHTRASDRAAEAMLKIESMIDKPIDVAVMIQGDEPMVYPEMIEQVVNPIAEDSTLQVTNLMAPLKTQEKQKDPNAVKVVTDKDNFALYFSREVIPTNKDAKSAIYKQIAIIPFRRDFLLKFNSLEPTPLERSESVDMLRLLEHGYRVKMVETDFEIQGVDTKEDLVCVEALLSKDSLLTTYKTI